jgi:hypothetical protein
VLIVDENIVENTITRIPVALANRSELCTEP